MRFHHIHNLIIIFYINQDLIHNLKSCFFTHGLDLADDLTYKTFLQQFRSQIGIQYNCCIAVCLCHIALCLGSLDQQIFLCQFNLISVDVQNKNTIGLQFIHCLASVDLSKCLTDTAQKLAIFRSNRTKLWLKAVGNKGFHIICEFYFFYIQFICNNISKECIHLLWSLHIHGTDRLTVLDVCSISAGTAKNNHLQHFFHIIFQFLIDPLFLHCREVAEMDTLRCSLINTSYQILINIFCHKRDQRSCCLGNGHKSCI